MIVILVCLKWCCAAGADTGLGLGGRREPPLVISNKSSTLFYFTCVQFIARYRTFRVDVLNEYRRCLAAYRIYTAFRRSVTMFCRSAPTWSASRNHFRRGGDCDLQAGVLSRWLVSSSDHDKRKFDRFMARFRADCFVVRNTHDIPPPLMKENEGIEFFYSKFTYKFSRFLYYNHVFFYFNFTY